MKVISNWERFNGSPLVDSAISPYFWTTTGDLLHHEKNSDGSENIMRDHLTPQNSLERDQSPPVHIPRGGGFREPTPDGTGLLYESANAVRPHDPDLHLLTAEGKQDRLLPSLWMMDRVWLPDGKHWLISRDDGDFMNGTDGIPLRKLNTRSVNRLYPFALGANRQSHVIATVGASQGFAAPYRGLPAVNFPTIFLTEFDPSLLTPALREWHVQVPALAASGRVAISPGGDRILWLVDERTPAIYQWLSRISARFQQPVVGNQAIYASRLDGSRMERLFSAPRVSKSWGRHGIWMTAPMSDIQWLPDGKRISFIYKNALYIAPVE